MTSRQNGKLSAEQLEKFKHMLLRRREILSGDADSIEKEANGKNGELSSVPFHMADAGSDNYDREFSLGILQNEKEEMREIDRALDRIDRNEFGLCESCGKAIPLARLKAIPNARLCIECKQNQESTGR